MPPSLTQMNNEKNKLDRNAAHTLRKKKFTWSSNYWSPNFGTLARSMNWLFNEIYTPFSRSELRITKYKYNHNLVIGKWAIGFDFVVSQWKNICIIILQLIKINIKLLRWPFCIKISNWHTQLYLYHKKKTFKKRKFLLLWL